ncbi:MAG: hypothetical protein ACLFWG_00290 [Longimicrobiales bacterium]
MDLGLRDLGYLLGWVVTIALGWARLESRVRSALESDTDQNEKLTRIEEEKLPSLRRDLEDGLQSLRDSNSESRAALHRKIDDVRDRVSRVEGRLDERGLDP